MKHFLFASVVENIDTSLTKIMGGVIQTVRGVYFIFRGFYTSNLMSIPKRTQKSKNRSLIGKLMREVHSFFVHPPYL